MLNVEKIISDKEQCLAHTGLLPEGFAYLLESFSVEYSLYLDERHKKRYWKERVKKRWWGNKWKLDTDEKKLFFVLYRLKTYQTYATLWWAFDMKKPRAYEWIQSTLPALLRSLKKTHYFLEQRRKNWRSCLQNTQKLETYLLMELKDL